MSQSHLCKEEGGAQRKEVQGRIKALVQKKKKKKTSFNWSNLSACDLEAVITIPYVCCLELCNFTGWDWQIDRAALF